MKWPYPTEPPRIPAISVAAGQVFFHGSSVRWGNFSGPLSLTSSRSHALRYAMEGAGQETHVRAFRLRKELHNVIDVPSLSDKENFDSAVYWLNDLSGTDEFYVLGHGQVSQAAWSKLAERGFGGAYMRRIDSGGDELIVFDPSAYLRPV